jgi:hypothetical protein
MASYLVQIYGFAKIKLENPGNYLKVFLVKRVRKQAGATDLLERDISWRDELLLVIGCAPYKTMDWRT